MNAYGKKTAGISVLSLLLAVMLMFAAGCGAFSCASADLPDAALDIYSQTLIVTHSSGGGEMLTGTGFIAYADGDTAYAITNYHVVEGAPDGEVTVRVGNAGLPATAEVVGYYEYHDIAVISLRSDGSFVSLSSDRFVTAETGEDVWSMGNEHGEGRLIVSDGETVASETTVTAERLGYYSVTGLVPNKYVPVTEYTCSVERGMSGCPIADADGNVTGVGTYRAEETTSDGTRMHYYGTDARFARSVLDAVLGGRFSSIDGGKEVALFGDGYYRIFIDRDGVRTRLVFLGNYYDWGAPLEGGTDGESYAARLHDIGFTAYRSYDGLVVGDTGSDCPLRPGDTITEIAGQDVGDMSYADIMTMFYDGFELTESGGDAVTVTTDRGEVALEGGGYAVCAK